VVYVSKTDQKTDQKKWFSKNGTVVQYYARFDGVRCSSDGTRMFFMVFYSSDSKFGNSGKNFSSLVGFDTDNLKFDPPFVKFQISPNDSMCDFHIGPILADTLTRFAFIHTKSALRVISLETVAEIVDETFPFKCKIQNFSPIVSSLCPTQRMLAFGSVDDARIVIYDLVRQNDSSTNSMDSSSSSSRVFDGLRLDPQYLQQFAVNTSGRSALHFNRSDKTLVNNFIMQIITECLDEASIIVQTHTSKKLRTEYLKGFYGDESLGVISPSSTAAVNDFLDTRPAAEKNSLSDDTLDMISKFIDTDNI
jgi:hypothetical protein